MEYLVFGRIIEVKFIGKVDADNEADAIKKGWDMDPNLDDIIVEELEDEERG